MGNALNFGSLPVHRLQSVMSNMESFGIVDLETLSRAFSKDCMTPGENH